MKGKTQKPSFVKENGSVYQALSLYNLPNNQLFCNTEHSLAVGDFTDIAEFRRDLDANCSDLKTCPKFVKKEKRLLHLENALNVDIPNLLDELLGINSMGARQGDIV